MRILDTGDSDGTTQDLNQYIWLNRLVVVFADSPNDPRFSEQLELLRAVPEELMERDVIVLTDTSPSSAGPLREKLRPRGFAVVLIGKDGGVKLRKPLPWSVREISRAIDKIPLRQREIQKN
ncbi:MAG: DUF4174 domain-containing protein [Rhodobacteraceae bacterium]|nr:DUF4174 domain-containing protein [Paracoccaceae bacterium]